MNNTYKKLCYRLLGRYIEGSSLENEFSLTLHQAEINIRGSMFLSVLFVSSLLLALAIGGILYILSIELINPISAAFLVFAASSGAVYFQLTSKIQDRRLAIDRHLPFAISHMSILAATGTPPLNLLHLLASSDHGAVSDEIKKIIYSVDILGKDLIAAIIGVARTTPSTHMRSMLIELTRMAHTGGSMESYLHGRLDQLLIIKREMQKELNMSLALFSEMYITFIGTGVIMAVLGVTVGSILMGGKIGPFPASVFFDIFIYFIMPAANVIFFVLLMVMYSPYGEE
ncbi:MAG: type II secretion system F family protein [Euryarchaeota archaeon]|nr:type II secretion system F family protein [Euryarchaeota archaeon]MCG2738216.1 type II secretion system F family protein [Candidatus Methanoperedenaceae archaeon]